jgi:hypothetical protein
MPGSQNPSVMTIASGKFQGASLADLTIDELWHLLRSDRGLRDYERAAVRRELRERHAFARFAGSREHGPHAL